MVLTEYRVTIKDLPVDLRPRERLLREGAEVLSDIELLAILLRTGTATFSAIDLAAEVLGKFDNLKSLVQSSVEELSSIKGIGLAKAAQVKAVLELGKRLAGTQASARIKINCPEDVVKLVMEEMRYLDREHFHALLLNTKNQVIFQDVVSIGNLNSSTVHPRELFKNAIKKSAAALILVHNHPSGDPTPSKEDVEITKRLSETGKIIGIEILDHIIVGDNKYVSFKVKGLL